jgi:hypothetical protein
MRAAPGRAFAAPQVIARKSRQIGIASLDLTDTVMATKVAEQSEFRVNAPGEPPRL